MADTKNFYIIDGHAHIYRAYFNVHALQNGYPGAAMATFSLGNSEPNPFNENGNYAYEIVAAEDPIPGARLCEHARRRPKACQAEHRRWRNRRRDDAPHVHFRPLP